MGKRIVGVNDRGLRVGQDHQRAKLTDAAVEMIRRLHEGGMGYDTIAAKFEVSKQVIAKICRYEIRATQAVRFKKV